MKLIILCLIALYLVAINAQDIPTKIEAVVFEISTYNFNDYISINLNPFSSGPTNRFSVDIYAFSILDKPDNDTLLIFGYDRTMDSTDSNPSPPMGFYTYSISTNTYNVTRLPGQSIYEFQTIAYDKVNRIVYASYIDYYKHNNCTLAVWNLNEKTWSNVVFEIEPGTVTSTAFDPSSGKVYIHFQSQVNSHTIITYNPSINGIVYTNIPTPNLVLGPIVNLEVINGNLYLIENQYNDNYEIYAINIIAQTLEPIYNSKGFDAYYNLDYLVYNNYIVLLSEYNGFSVIFFDVNTRQAKVLPGNNNYNPSNLMNAVLWIS